MLMIRLTRMGKKHQPSYRVVVTPKTNPVAGQYLDLLGTYDPLKSEVSIDSERTVEWLNKGAQPSERVARLLDKAGLKHKSIVIKYYTPKPKEDKVAEVATETPAEESAVPAVEELAEEAADVTVDEATEKATEEATESSEESPAA